MTASEAEPTPKISSHGPDPWKVVKGVTLCVWDAWLLSLWAKDFDQSWEKLRVALRRRDHMGWFERERAESLQSQLDDLRERLVGTDTDGVKLLGELFRDGGLLRKARTKVFEREIPEREKTPPMLDTPRRRLNLRARSGHWPQFPVSPKPYEAEFVGEVEDRDHYGESATMALVRRLEEIWAREKLRVGADPAKRLALHRGAMTALIEAVERSDDSCGSLGDFFGEVLAEYLKTDWRKTTIPVQAYYRDFLEFTVWEDYGFTHERLTPFFRSIRPEEVAIVDSLMREIKSELRQHGFDHQLEEVWCLTSEFYAEKKCFDRYLALAREAGSRVWEPAILMAKAACKAGKRDLAFDVFCAADKPGFQREYLRGECKKMLGREPLARPRLRRVR